MGWWILDIVTVTGLRTCLRCIKMDRPLVVFLDLVPLI
jgi:hypothetical protein